jgi:very-short-patch-repair endonuclease
MGEPRRETDGTRPERVALPADRAIAALAGRQHGVITTRQLASLGLTPRAVSHRVASGRLHRVHRGVYAVGRPLLTARGRYMAAVLACGPGAALSHASAAALWDLRPTAATKIDVSVPTAGGRRQSTFRVHRARSLRPTEVTTHDGIPVTTPARTLLDLAATLPQRGLERALDQAEIQELTDYPHLEALARAHPRHRGATPLLAALGRHTAGTTLTKSDLEERFLALCRANALPTPQVNTYAEGFEVDFLFAAHRVAVETDSWRYHHTRQAFERDRARDAALAAAGYRSLRFTDLQVETEPRTVVHALAAALDGSRPR